MKKEQGYNTEWNLSYFYKSFKEIDGHIEEIDKAFSTFEKKYKKKDDYLRDEDKLLKALLDLEKLIEINPSKPLRYLSLLHDLDSQDKKVEAKLNQVTQTLTAISNKILFFDLKLGTIPSSKQRTLLKSKKLEHFKFYLSILFEQARYHLSEPEEKILSLKRLPSYELWTNGVEKNVNALMIPFKGEDLPLAEALNKINELPTEERRSLWNNCMKALEKVEDFAESEMNAIVINKKINDELRGYEKPYSSTVIGYQNDEKSVETLVDTITSQFKISHKFYKVKKAILGLDTLTYADRAASIGKIHKEFSFGQSVAMLKEAFEGFGGVYKDILERMMDNGQIDAYPKKGKRGGAYCAGTEGLSTFVLLNHVDTYDSYNTFAHEMGHAIHYELSKSQPLLYQEFSISIAEVASTFFENLAFDRLFKELNDIEKVIALHNKVNGSISTIHRQIAFFNFEKDLHTQIREQGALSKGDIKKLLTKHMRSYMGSVVDVTDLDSNFFINIPHFRSFFYVYAYAYGEIISTALYEKYLEDPSYEEKIRRFLSAGGSMKPDDVFASIGINTKDPEFFRLGLKKIEKDITMLEKLAKKAGMVR